MIIPLEDDDLGTTCRTLSKFTIGDLVDLKLARASFYTPGHLAPLAPYLFEDVPLKKQPLGVGKYWKIAYRHKEMKFDDVIQIDIGGANSVVDA